MAVIISLVVIILTIFNAKIIHQQFIQIFNYYFTKKMVIVGALFIGVFATSTTIFINEYLEYMGFNTIISIFLSIFIETVIFAIVFTNAWMNR